MKVVDFKANFNGQMVVSIVAQTNSPLSLTFRSMEVQYQMQTNERRQVVRLYTGNDHPPSGDVDDSIESKVQTVK